MRNNMLTSGLEPLTVKAAGKRTLLDNFMVKQLLKFGGDRLNFLYGNKRHGLLLIEPLTLITTEPTDSIDTGKEAHFINPSALCMLLLSSSRIGGTSHEIVVTPLLLLRHSAKSSISQKELLATAPNR